MSSLSEVASWQTKATVVCYFNVDYTKGKGLASKSHTLVGHVYTSKSHTLVGHVYTSKSHTLVSHIR